MRAHVFLLRRHGVLLPWLEATNRPPMVGDLSLSMMHHKDSSVQSLSLTRPNDTSQRSTLAKLMEPALVTLGHGRMRLRGIEAVQTSDGKAGMVQEWLVEIVTR